jgi:hypothetical protein
MTHSQAILFASEYGDKVLDKPLPNTESLLISQMEVYGNFIEGFDVFAIAINKEDSKRVREDLINCLNHYGIEVIEKERFGLDAQ